MDRSADRVVGKRTTRFFFNSNHAAALLIFICAFSIFRFSPIHPINDSKYSMMLSQALIEHRSFRLDNYAIPRLNPVVREDYVQNGDIYQIEQIGPHLYYFFPPGSSVLSVPFVLVANAFGVSAVNADKTFNLQGEQQIESWLAAFLMAMLAVVQYFTARFVLPVKHSLVITIAATLGTQIWSTASRAMFTDTWPVFLLTCALFLIVRGLTRNCFPHPIGVATLLAGAYFCYPLYIVHLAAVAVYFLLKNRGHFIMYCVTAAIWLAGFVVYSWLNFHQLLPNYFAASRLNFNGFFFRLVGHLFGPSRGLLIFVPTTLIVVYLLIRFRASLQHRTLVAIGCGAILAQLLVISAFVHWWGGHSFGPRFLTASVPWFTVLSIFGLDALRRSNFKTHKRVLATVGILLVAFSIFVHGRGATATATAAWNSLPADVDKHPERLWDWRQPQFLAGLIKPPRPSEYPAIQLNVPIDFTRSESDKYLWYGWSTPEPVGRWSDSNEATMVFAVNKVEPVVLKLSMAPFVVPERLTQQKVVVRLNGTQAAELFLTAQRINVYSIALSQPALRQNNVLTFELPNAASPASFNLGADERRLGIRIESAEFMIP